jgi:hypothetical protein
LGGSGIRGGIGVVVGRGGRHSNPLRGWFDCESLDRESLDRGVDARAFRGNAIAGFPMSRSSREQDARRDKSRMVCSLVEGVRSRNGGEKGGLLQHLHDGDYSFL